MCAAVAAYSAISGNASRISVNASAVRRVEAGFVWINETSRHIVGTPFGGFKQSGLGREECLEELISFTREKHVHINTARRAGGGQN